MLVTPSSRRLGKGALGCGPGTFHLTNRGESSVSEWLHLRCKNQQEILQRYYKGRKGVISKCKYLSANSSSHSNLHSPRRSTTQPSAPTMSQLSALPKPQTAQSPPTPSYPTGFAFGMTLFALFISLFCVALDSTIIATAVPRITDQFHALQDVGWYGSSYLLTKCGM